MATGLQCNGDAVVNGNLRLSGLMTPTRTRAEILSQVDLCPLLIPWTAWRIWDNVVAPLGATALSDDDLLMTGGTFATDPPCIQAGDVKAASKTRYARCQIAMPWDYVAGQTVTLRFHAGMVTTVAATSCLLDVSAYASDEELGLSADLCATAAQSMNSVTFADLDFVITPTALVAGSLLDIRIEIASVDAATGTPVIPTIGAAKLLYDAR